jgi:hypothetical protein
MNTVIGVLVGFSCKFLLGILIFKGLTARRLCKSFGVKGLSGRPPGKGVHYTVDLALLSCTEWQKHHLTLAGNLCNIIK